MTLINRIVLPFAAGARRRRRLALSCLAVGCLAAHLPAADAPPLFVLAQSPTAPALTITEVVDADFLAVPVTLVPSGDTPTLVYEQLRKARAALDQAFGDPYRLSAQPRAIPSDAEISRLQNGSDAGSTAGASTGPAPLPGGMRSTLLIVRPMTQIDPERAAVEIYTKLTAFAAANPQCGVIPGTYRLGLGDPERYRHDLLLRLERFTETNRIAVPKASKAWLSGLEQPLEVDESADGRQVVVGLPFQLRFEEAQ